MADDLDVTRRTLLRNTALGTMALAGVDHLFGQKLPVAPNIVFILADDLGYADVSCYGRPDIRTPNIDGLAARGVQFLQAYANSAVCSATRTALITGRYQYRLPIGLEEPLGGPRCRPAAEHPTLPSLLKKAGYSTTLVGKWHLGLLPKFGPLQSGYDHFYGFRGGAVDYYSARLPKRRSVGRRRAGPPDGLPDGSARQPCRGRGQWICEVGPSVSDESAFQRAALAVGGAGRRSGVGAPPCSAQPA